MFIWLVKEVRFWRICENESKLCAMTWLHLQEKNLLKYVFHLCDKLVKRAGPVVWKRTQRKRSGGSPLLDWKCMSIMSR